MLKWLAHAYYILSTMLSAGMPVLRSLQTCAGSMRGRLGSVFNSIHESVRAGRGLADTMESYPRIFAPLDVTIVRAGEQSGSLAESLADLAKWYQFRIRLRGIIRSGMMLPLLLIHAAALIGPVSSLALGGWDFVGYIRDVLGILAVFYIPLLAILGVVFYTPRRGVMRRMLDGFLLYVPILGMAIRQLSLSRFCRVFSILCRAGVPVTRCMDMASQAAGNAVIMSQLSGGVDAVKAGNPTSEGFSKKLPLDFLNLWQVGEETGDIDEVSSRLAESTAETAERLFEELAKWTPRLVYAFVSCIIIWQIFKGFGQISSSMMPPGF